MGYTEQNTNGDETISSKIHINWYIIIKDILKNLVVIILVSLIVAGIAYLIKENTHTPKYQARTTFLVSSADGSSYNNKTSLATLMQQVMDSQLLKKIMAQDLGLDGTTVPATITTTVQSDVNIMNVTVTAETPRMAFLVMDSLTENYSQVSDYLMEGLVLDVLEPARIPTASVSQTGARELFKKAFLYAFCILVVCTAVLSYARDTVKSERDVKEKIDTPLFVTIYREYAKKKKDKKSILITGVNVSFSFVETFKKIRTRIEYEAHKNDCRVIMVTSVMENEGKSTVAANIALALAQKAKNVVLVDADFRKPAQFKVFDAGTQEAGLGEVLQGKNSLEDVIRLYEPGGLYCLYNYKAYRNSSEMLLSAEMKNLIGLLREKMSYVIIDTPPTSMVADAEIVSRYADASLLVVREDRAVCAEINDTIDMLSGNKSKLLGCIYNFAERGFEHFAPDSNGYGNYGKYGKYGRYEYGGYNSTRSQSNPEKNTVTTAQKDKK